MSEKKFGFVCDDQESFGRIAQRLGLHEKSIGVWARHPLAFLMEAADDICYRIVDLEDGCRLGRVSFEEAESLLKPLTDGQGESLERGSYGLITDEKGKVEYLRARVINNLILEVVQVFIKYYDEIMAGNLERDLISLSRFESELGKIKLLSQKKVYSTPNVLHIEAAGFEVLGGLLGKIVPAVIEGAGKKNAANEKLRALIPMQFVGFETRYKQLLGATDHVSGMTDSFAVTHFRRLKGIELPRG